MMELVNAKLITNLIEIKDNPCISIYVPTHKEWDKLQHDKTLFKNQLSKVKDQLLEHNFKEDEIVDLLKEAKELLSDDHFWQHQSLGLAVFISRKHFRYFRLPRKFSIKINVSNHFYIKPLIPLISDEGRYYLLSIELSKAVLYLGTKYSISEINLPDETPKSLEETLQFDDPEKSIQHHTVSGSSNVKSAIFHGQGSGSDEKRKKKEILRFYQLLSKGLMEKIGSDNAPLITIGVEYLHPIFKEANLYSNLVADIDIDPQSLTIQDLKEKGWNKVNVIFETKKEKAIEEFGKKTDADLTSTKLNDIIKGSFHQRVDKLFIDIEDSQYGIYNPVEDKLKIDDERTAGNEDLHNLTIIKTLENNGSVFYFDKTQIPGSNSIAAVFRY